LEDGLKLGANGGQISYQYAKWPNSPLHQNVDKPFLFKRLADSWILGFDIIHSFYVVEKSFRK
jgi:hypothetical protein